LSRPLFATPAEIPNEPHGGAGERSEHGAEISDFPDDAGGQADEGDDEVGPYVEDHPDDHADEEAGESHGFNGQILGRCYVCDDDRKDRRDDNFKELYNVKLFGFHFSIPLFIFLAVYPPGKQITCLLP